jgi:hypothetical protein
VGSEDGLNDPRERRVAGRTQDLVPKAKSGGKDRSLGAPLGA